MLGRGRLWSSFWSARIFLDDYAQWFGLISEDTATSVHGLHGISRTRIVIVIDERVDLLASYWHEFATVDSSKPREDKLNVLLRATLRKMADFYRISGPICRSVSERRLLQQIRHRAAVCPTVSHLFNTAIGDQLCHLEKGLPRASFNTNYNYYKHVRTLMLAL